MKKLMALLLVAAFTVCMFAGCGSSAASASSAAAASTESAAAEDTATEDAATEDAAPAADTDTDAAAASAEDVELADESYGAPVEIDGWTPSPYAHYSEGDDVSARVIDYDYEHEYNLADYRVVDEGETITLNMFYALQNQYEGLFPDNDYYQNGAMQRAEEATGVHLDFVIASGQESDTQLSLMLASGDYTNMIDQFLTSYTAGADSAIEDDIIYDLTDYLSEYAPDYYEIINATEDVRKSTKSDTGKNAAFFNFSELQAGPRGGMFIRQDWLDELGLDTPVTYDDVHDVLTAFKENYNPTMPLLMTSPGIMLFDQLSAGYGVAYDQSGGFYQVDGEVRYCMTEEGYRDYVTMIHQWYEEGLISSDFTSMMWMLADDTVLNNNTGIWGSFSRQTNAWVEALQETDENAAISPLPNTVQNEGDTIHIDNTKSYVDKYGCSITTACDEDQLIAAIKWNNFWYTDLGTLLCNYGIEGVSFEFDEEGIPHFTDLITNSEDYTMSQAIWMNATVPFNSVYQNRTGDLETYDKAAWNVNNDGAYDLPGYLTMTAEESEEYTSTFNTIDTYVTECLEKFIVGDMDISEFDTYVQNIYDMGIEDCIAIKQAAYDRYQAR